VVGAPAMSSPTDSRYYAETEKAPFSIFSGVEGSGSSAIKHPPTREQSKDGFWVEPWTSDESAGGGSLPKDPGVVVKPWTPTGLNEKAFLSPTGTAEAPEVLLPPAPSLEYKKSSQSLQSSNPSYNEKVFLQRQQQQQQQHPRNLQGMFVPSPQTEPTPPPSFSQSPPPLYPAAHQPSPHASFHQHEKPVFTSSPTSHRSRLPSLPGDAAPPPPPVVSPETQIFVHVRPPAQANAPNAVVRPLPVPSRASSAASTTTPSLWNGSSRTGGVRPLPRLPTPGTQSRDRASSAASGQPPPTMPTDWGR